MVAVGEKSHGDDDVEFETKAWKYGSVLFICKEGEKLGEIMYEIDTNEVRVNKIIIGRKHRRHGYGSKLFTKFLSKTFLRDRDLMFPIEEHAKDFYVKFFQRFDHHFKLILNRDSIDSWAWGNGRSVYHACLRILSEDDPIFLSTRWKILRTQQYSNLKQPQILRLINDDRAQYEEGVNFCYEHAKELTREQADVLANEWVCQYIIEHGIVVKNILELNFKKQRLLTNSHYQNLIDAGKCEISWDFICEMDDDQVYRFEKLFNYFDKEIEGVSIFWFLGLNDEEYHLFSNSCVKSCVYAGLITSVKQIEDIGIEGVEKLISKRYNRNQRRYGGFGRLLERGKRRDSMFDTITYNHLAGDVWATMPGEEGKGRIYLLKNREELLVFEKESKEYKKCIRGPNERFRSCTEEEIKAFDEARKGEIEKKDERPIP